MVDGHPCGERLGFRGDKTGTGGWRWAGAIVFGVWRALADMV